MAWRGHGRGVLRGARREEKERDQIPRGREAGGGRAGEFYQPQRLLARLWRRLHGKKEGKISDNKRIRKRTTRGSEKEQQEDQKKDQEKDRK